MSMRSTVAEPGTGAVAGARRTTALRETPVTVAPMTVEASNPHDALCEITGARAHCRCADRTLSRQRARETTLGRLADQNERVIER